MPLVLPDDGWAQEKRKIAWTAPAPNSKYTQQHTIDVGDVPGHQVRIVEIHQTYPGGAPVFDGVRVVEDWFRGYSDYTNVNGHAWGYGQYVLENGDKILAKRLEMLGNSAQGLAFWENFRAVFYSSAPATAAAP